MNKSVKNIAPFLFALLGLVVVKLIQRRRQMDLTGRVVIITGGSRGLGLLLARAFAREGCRLAIGARDEAELERAKAELEKEYGVEVLAVPCDVADRNQVEVLVDKTLRRFEKVDILVNNAGIIQVGPLRTMTLQDFEDALGVMYWGPLYTSLSVLPHMQARRQGHIVNITSIGGKVSVPHLLPYACAKFAAVGLSEGLRAELLPQRIAVTTVVPGLMRTGSFLNAYFNGRQQGEFTWFSLGSSLPLISMNAERAAEKIVRAVKQRRSEVILSLPAKLIAWFHGLFPGTTANIMGLVERFILPPAAGATSATSRGMEVKAALPSVHDKLLSGLTVLGNQAARRFHQYPGPVTVATQDGKDREKS